MSERTETLAHDEIRLRARSKDSRVMKVRDEDEYRLV